jgi:hypothetical protein
MRTAHEPYECPFPVVTVRSIGQRACIGCACEPGTCVFLPAKSYSLFAAALLTDSSQEVMSMWQGVFAGTDCVNSMVAFFGSWFFVGVLVSLVKRGAEGSREEEHAAKLVQHLVHAGAQVDAPWVIGRTALYAAAFYGQVRMFKMLLLLNADPTIRDQSGCVVLSAFGRSRDRFAAEADLVLLLVHRRLPLSLLWEFVDDNVSGACDLRSFVSDLMPRIRSARAAIQTVLIAHRAAPLSVFGHLPREVVEHIVSYLCFCQTDVVWVES